MSRRSEYVFGALTLGTLLYCVGVSAVKSTNYFVTQKTTKIRTLIPDPNGQPAITQFASYTYLDTDKDGNFDTFDITHETFYNQGNNPNKPVAQKKETRKLEELTDEEAIALKLTQKELAIRNSKKNNN